MILEGTFTPLDYGAFGLCFLILSLVVRPLIQLVADLIKKKTCKAFEKGNCPLFDEWQEMRTEVREILELIRKLRRK